MFWIDYYVGISKLDWHLEVELEFSNCKILAWLRQHVQFVMTYSLFKRHIAKTTWGWRNSKFQQLTGQAGKLRYMNSTFTSKYNNGGFQYYIKVYNHVLVFHTKIQFIVYLLFDSPACPVSLLNFWISPNSNGILIVCFLIMWIPCQSYSYVSWCWGLGVLRITYKFSHYFFVWHTYHRHC